MSDYYSVITSSNIYSGPSRNSKELGKTTKEEIFKIKSKSSNWINIGLGWIESNTLKEEDIESIEERYTISQNDNYDVINNTIIYSGPGINYEKIGELKTKQIVHVIEEDETGNWVNINSGWIVSSDIYNYPSNSSKSQSKTMTNGMFYINNNDNVYLTPYDNSLIIGNVYEMERIYVIGTNTSEGWVKISTGWIKNNVVNQAEHLLPTPNLSSSLSNVCYNKKLHECSCTFIFDKIENLVNKENINNIDDVIISFNISRFNNWKLNNFVLKMFNSKKSEIDINVPNDAYQTAIWKNLCFSEDTKKIYSFSLKNDFLFYGQDQKTKLLMNENNNNKVKDGNNYCNFLIYFREFLCKECLQDYLIIKLYEYIDVKDAENIKNNNSDNENEIFFKKFLTSNNTLNDNLNKKDLGFMEIKNFKLYIMYK